MSAPFPHTPGRWVTRCREREVTVETLDGEHLLALVTARDLEPEREANARLMAAAPDLLAACHELLRVWPLSGYELEAFCSATLVPLVRGLSARAKGGVS